MLEGSRHMTFYEPTLPEGAPPERTRRVGALCNLHRLMAVSWQSIPQIPHELDAFRPNSQFDSIDTSSEITLNAKLVSTFYER